MPGRIASPRSKSLGRSFKAGPNEMPHVPLQAYVDMQHKMLLAIRDADQQALKATREADQRAQEAAVAALNLRLAAMNEFRKTVEDVVAKTVTRSEAMGFIAGAIGLALAALSLLMK